MSRSLDLFIFVDALGWKQAQARGFLADLLPERSECRTVFGYSSTCDPTILTGCMPDEHDHFSCFVKARSERPFAKLGLLGFLPHRLVGWHRVRHHVSRFVARSKGYSGYFQLYSVPFSKLPHLDYTEKRDIYGSGGILGGQEPIFAEWARAERAWVRSDWRCGDDENICAIRSEIEKGDIELGYLFTAKPDAIMHRYGTTGPEVDAGFENLEGKIRDLFELASRRYDEVRFYVFGDHGMSDTTEVSELMPRWDKELGGKYGRDYVAVWDSTMARFWFEDAEFKGEAVDWLSGQKDGRIVEDEQLKQWRCWWDDGRYGELFYLLPPGSIFAPSFMNQGFVAGMHGYEPEHEDCSAAWLTNAEGCGVTGLEDIYSVMQGAAEARSERREEVAV